MKVPELQDDERAGVKWGRALKDFIERCLERDPTKRPGPNKMMSHPFVRKSETRQPQPDIARFVADVWGWPTPSDTQAAAVTPTTPIAIPIPRAAVRAPMVDADLDADGRTPAERAAAKEREAALGLVGSPSD